MQKILKRFALVVSVALTIICLCAFMAACGDDKDSAKDYAITVVYPDETAVDGTKDGKAAYDPDDTTVEVQICVVKADGTTGSCFDKAKLDANGKATLAAPDYKLADGEKFKIQVNNVPDGYKCDDSRIYVCTTYFTAPGAYTVTLEAE